MTNDDMTGMVLYGDRCRRTLAKDKLSDAMASQAILVKVEAGGEYLEEKNEWIETRGSTQGWKAYWDQMEEGSYDRVRDGIRVYESFGAALENSGNVPTIISSPWTTMRKISYAPDELKEELVERVVDGEKITVKDVGDEIKDYKAEAETQAKRSEEWREQCLKERDAKRLAEEKAEGLDEQIEAGVQAGHEEWLKDNKDQIADRETWLEHTAGRVKVLQDKAAELDEDVSLRLNHKRALEAAEKALMGVSIELSEVMEDELIPEDYLGRWKALVEKISGTAAYISAKVASSEIVTDAIRTEVKDAVGDLPAIPAPPTFQ